MSRRRRFETIGATSLILALVGGTVTAASAADTVIASDDFSAPLSSSWQQSGGPTLSVVDVEGDPALQVANRTNDYDGIETAPGVIDAGETYDVSMRVRLAAGTAGTATFKLVAVPGYATVPGTELAVTADGWTTLSGRYTMPDDAVDPKFYIGTSALSGAYTYLVDDVELTLVDTSAPVVVVVSDDDFSAPLDAAWRQSGGPTLSIVEVDGNPALQIANRANDYDGIETAPGTLEPGGTYTVSVRARVAADAGGTPSLRFVQNYQVAGAEQYIWVDGTNTTLTADGWVTITGTFTIPEAATNPRIYTGTSALAGAYTYLLDDLLLTTTQQDDGSGPTDPGTPGAVVLETSFEEGLAPWQLRRSSAIEGITPDATVTSDLARTGAQSAVVLNRGNQGDGLGLPTAGILLPGLSYELTAWVRFASGQPAGDIWVTLQADSSFLTQAQITGLTNNGWTQIEAAVTMPPTEPATGLLYLETAYVAPPATGNTSTFYVDDVTITQAEELTIEDDLTPILSTVDFPIGVAVDARETGGAQADLVNLHFEQLTAENSMKPEAFYNGAREFVAPADATAVMDFAAENDLRVWGHTLVWHAQTPAWFFQTAEGAPLTTSDTDKQVLRDRMRDHIFAVAELYADEYGLYGDGNPIVAFDVVNEVITDASGLADGLRRSEWYRILGEEFIDLAFQYADEAFNDEFAAPGSDRPVALFINDYNTELTPKGTRMLALLERLLERGVPVDGVGHQMHVSLSFPVDDLGATLDRFAPLGLLQAVTELDVPTGTPESEAKFIDQGYFYRDAFRAFRDFHDRTDQLFSVTVWGLSDNRSWRAANGGPLLFDERLQAKPAYFGVVDDDLEAPQRSANVFGATVTTVDDRQWQRMPDVRIDSSATFQVRWSVDELHVLVEVDDATPQATDAIELELEGTTVTVDRDDAQVSTASGWATVVSLPLGGAGEGDLVDFDVRVIDGGDLRSAWNAPGVLGTLTLLEPLSFVEVVETATAPVIDGAIDEAWAAATVVETGKQVEGTSGATAEVRTLWRDDRLYVLMEVADPVIDVSGSDPWIQDSVEVYVDAGNFKNGSYRYDDMQLRISAANVVTVGAGDEAFQRARIESQTATVDGGYIVEISISLLTESGLGTVHGLDFQVNDAASGARQSIRNWADPSAQGYLSTARWGVGQLVAAPDAEPQLVIDAESPQPGEQVSFSLDGLEPGAEVELVLVPDTGDTQPVLGVSVVRASAAAPAAAIEFPLSLGFFTADENGRVAGTVTIPAIVPPGDYLILALVDGEEVASSSITVAAAAPTSPGQLSNTGAADVATLLAIAALLMACGLVVVLRSSRRASTRNA